MRVRSTVFLCKPAGFHLAAFFWAAKSLRKAIFPCVCAILRTLMQRFLVSTMVIRMSVIDALSPASSVGAWHEKRQHVILRSSLQSVVWHTARLFYRSHIGERCGVLLELLGTTSR